mmetsp:Transcript_68815/g.109179  ORF Transcript_68815/g.109179 Transcript_68815/m.109179 type:complete len:254 (+) Transcript_68815:82-843(+)
MRSVTVALVGSASVAVVCMFLAPAAVGRSHWSAPGGAQPWQPSSSNSRGLVREEELRGANVLDEEELELRKHLPNGFLDLSILLARGMLEKVTIVPRLTDFNDSMLAGQSHIMNELRVHVEETLLLLKLGLQLLGTLLTLLVPITIISYALLSQPFRLPTPLIFLRLADLISFALLPLDRLLSPVLRLLMRITGLVGEIEPLLNGASGCELLNKGKRILLGLLVLNVIISLLTFFLLACFVGIVRFSGILRHP